MWRRGGPVIRALICARWTQIQLPSMLCNGQLIRLLPDMEILKKLFLIYNFCLLTSVSSVSTCNGAKHVKT